MKEQYIGEGIYGEIDEHGQLMMYQHSCGLNLWKHTLNQETTQNLFKLLQNNLGPRKNSSKKVGYKRGFGNNT